MISSVEIEPAFSTIIRTERLPSTWTTFAVDEAVKGAATATVEIKQLGVDLKVIDEKGNRAPADGKSSGELFVRGSTIVSGYFNNPEASAKQMAELPFYTNWNYAHTNYVLLGRIIEQVSGEPLAPPLAPVSRLRHTR